MNKRKNTILISICGILTMMTIFVSINCAVNGMEMTSLEKTETDLIATKKDLEDNLAKLNSISQYETKVDEFGFVKTSEVLYITVSGPVAQLQ